MKRTKWYYIPGAVLLFTAGERPLEEVGAVLLWLCDMAGQRA